MRKAFEIVYLLVTCYIKITSTKRCFLCFSNKCQNSATIDLKIRKFLAWKNCYKLSIMPKSELKQKFKLTTRHQIKYPSNKKEIKKLTY